MTLLFPNYLKGLSRIIFYATFLFGVIYLIFLEGEDDIEKIFTFTVPALLSSEIFGPMKTGLHWIEAMFLDETISIFIVVFGILAGFSKEQHEDELIDKMRNDSLRWSLFINYGIILITVLGVYGGIYLSFLFSQLFLILFLFNLIFDIKLLRHYKSARHEE